MLIAGMLTGCSTKNAMFGEALTQEQMVTMLNNAKLTRTTEKFEFYSDGTFGYQDLTTGETKKGIWFIESSKTNYENNEIEDLLCVAIGVEKRSDFTFAPCMKLFNNKELGDDVYLGVTAFCNTSKKNINAGGVTCDFPNRTYGYYRIEDSNSQRATDFNPEILGSFKERIELSRRGNPKDEGQFPVYGNWCGPKHPKKGRSPIPIDEIDNACKKHDLCYSSNEYFSCKCDAQLLFDLSEIKRQRLKGKGFITYKEYRELENNITKIIRVYFASTACSPEDLTSIGDRLFASALTYAELGVDTIGKTSANIFILTSGVAIRLPSIFIAESLTLLVEALRAVIDP